MTVTQFPKQDEPKKIWVCDCGSASFYLGDDGAADCCMCGMVAITDAGAWSDAIKDGDIRDENAPVPIIDYNGNGSIDFARRRMSGLANDPDASAIVVILGSGSVSVWSMASGQDQLDWVLDHIDGAKAILQDREKNAASQD